MKVTIKDLLALPVGGYLAVNTIENDSHSIRSNIMQSKLAIRFWWTIRKTADRKLILITKVSERRIGEKRCENVQAVTSHSKNYIAKKPTPRQVSSAASMAVGSQTIATR